MEPKIEFYESAFNHKGISEDDIRHAVKTRIRKGMMPEYPYAEGLAGFDSKGRLLEICYHDGGDGTISVFHAMKCRKSFLAKLVQEDI